MNKKSILLVLAGFFIALMTGAGLLYTRLGESFQPAVVVPRKSMYAAEKSDTWVRQNLAPDFTAYTADGEPAKLSDYFGKPLVLNFWASWCGPCQREMPHFEQAYRDMGDEVQFLMVNMTGGRESLKSAQNFLASTGYTFPVLFDLDQSAAYTYGTYTLPMTVFISANGSIQDVAIGAINQETLLTKIQAILPDES